MGGWIEEPALFCFGRKSEHLSDTQGKGITLSGVLALGRGHRPTGRGYGGSLGTMLY